MLLALIENRKSSDILISDIKMFVSLKCLDCDLGTGYTYTKIRGSYAKNLRAVSMTAQLSSMH